MRIIVISDTHGNYDALRSVIDRNTDADWIFHLGDGERELDTYIAKNPVIAPKIIFVAGNCDYGSTCPGTFVLPVGEHKIFATHGYRFGVNSSLETLKKMAEVNGCDIVLYGHTHARFQGFQDGMYILNPGSASCPRDGNKPSFGHIDISPAGIETNIADI